jgi:putative ABC transport system ATP-binding protein
VIVSSTAVLTAQALTKQYGSGPGRVEALRGIDLALASGEFVAVMGSSGSGKSTLLHLLAGLDRPTGGRVWLGGIDLGTLTEDGRALLRRQHIGLIFQSFQLLDTLTAEENVALPLAISGCRGRQLRVRAAEALDVVGLAHRAGHRPHELSGGEQQRVAIARALVTDPPILLADEPTGNLDSVHGTRIIALLRRLVDERRHALLLVTHDPGHAGLADRILRLHDGRLAEEAEGPTDPKKAVFQATTEEGP